MAGSSPAEHLLTRWGWSDGYIQWARNLTDAQDGFLKGKRILIHDRDPLYTKKFRETLLSAGVRSLKLPKMSPNLSPYAERFLLAIKSECLDKMIFFGEKQIRHAVPPESDGINRAPAAPKAPVPREMVEV